LNVYASDVCGKPQVANIFHTMKIKALLRVTQKVYNNLL